MPVGYLITCEHGISSVPREYALLFRSRRKLLFSHRGYDRGSRELAECLAERLRALFLYAKTSRLLADLNRSPGHPRLFSEVTRGLTGDEKEDLLAKYYYPYRDAVTTFISGSLARGRRVVHLSVHTFTPVFEGKVRNADAGFLYDPARPSEMALCRAWQEALKKSSPSLKVRRNYPYQGVSDGLVSGMRKLYSARQYLGVELELNQRHVKERQASWKRLQGLIAEGLEEALEVTGLDR